MNTLREILSPDFLLRNSIYVSLLIGIVCPIVGVYLLVRRLVFMGVALPQVSSCGIALAFSLQAWGIIPHIHQNEHQLALFGAALFTLPTILLLSVTHRHSRNPIEGRLGMLYALAGAWSILLLVKNPLGEHGLLDMMKGEIIAISNEDLVWTATTVAMVLAVLLIFRKEFLLVSFDREMAIALKKNALFWDSLLFLVIGLTISISVLSVGPLVAFGFLLLPPLTAHQVSRNMRQFTVLAVLLGACAAFAGFCLAYQWDLPVGPTDVALLGVVYAVVSSAKFFLGKTAIQRPKA